MSRVEISSHKPAFPVLPKSVPPTQQLPTREKEGLLLLSSPAPGLLFVPFVHHCHYFQVLQVPKRENPQYTPQYSYFRSAAIWSTSSEQYLPRSHRKDSGCQSLHTVSRPRSRLYPWGWGPCLVVITPGGKCPGRGAGVAPHPATVPACD